MDCTDLTDELDCSCKEHEFKCQCYNNNPVSCKADSSGRVTGCIPIERYHDGVKQCSDGSDENQFQIALTCGQCEVKIYRLLNQSNRGNLIFRDNVTCHSVSSLSCPADCNTTDYICISNCFSGFTKKCNRFFQCNDGSLGLAFQFCNGNTECDDHSDEIVNQPGFKCVGFKSLKTCVLPQRNLYDDIAQCSDESDLCRNNSCFQCFDRRLLISSKQVCDGVFDCYDWSDECLCEVNFNKASCKARFSSSDIFFGECTHLHNLYSNDNIDFSTFTKVSSNNSLLRKICQTRRSDRTVATLCDGRPECSDLSDECDCENPPKFCNDTCHSDYFIGDRYCDGIEDEFYKIINKSNCPKGFEEFHCPKRFYCKAGAKVSIESNQKCDGVQDCDNSFDEKNCLNADKNIFSSDHEMIANPWLKSLFWFMGITVITGNLYVIFITLRFLKTTKLNKSYKYQKLIILNISFADFIMGIYLLLISIYNLYFSGYYGSVDYKWRSSLSCSIIGCLTILSSEASCLFLVFLTGCRVYTIFKPFAKSFFSPALFGLTVASIWLISFAVAVAPILKYTSGYFVYRAEFSNRFTFSKIQTKVNITNFACRLAKLSNTSIEENGKTWGCIKKFLEENFPDYSIGLEFGYYGQTSVCMPRFYVVQGEQSWEYSLSIIITNFVSFLFIALSYIWIYTHSTKNQVEMKDHRRLKENLRMQRRISRIIMTDFFCWIPICIMAFIKLSGGYISDIAYIISACLLLPVNSAVNPLLYTTFFDKCTKINSKLKQSKKNQHEIVRLKSLKRVFL